MNTDKPQSDEIEWDLEDMKQAYKDAAEKGYDANIIKYTIDRDVDLKESLVLGTYNNTTLFFDSFSFNYVHRNYNIKDQKTKIDSAGRNFAPEGVADEFKAYPSIELLQVKS